MKLSDESAGLVTLGAIQAFQLFTTLCPTHSDILSSSSEDTVTRELLRGGEFTASLLSMAFSILLSLLTGDALPLWIGAAACVTMITAYEITLNRSM